VKTAKSVFFILCLALTALLFTACGGGGGDDGTVSTPTTGVSITDANAELIAAKVVDSISVLESVTQPADILTGVSIDVSESAVTYPDLILWILEQPLDLSGQASVTTPTGVVVSETIACTDGGSYTIEADVSDPNLSSVGDSYDLTFYSCAEMGVVLNGSMRFTITELSGDLVTPPYVLGVRVVLTAFSVNDGTVVITSNGDMNIRLSENLAGDMGLVLSGNSLTATVGSISETISNYLYDVTGNDTSGAFSFDIQGTFASTEIGGSVSFVTNPPFTGNDFVGGGNPTAGVMLITTSIDSSRARVSAQPSGYDVLIEVDHDGDGLYETTIMTTWAALESL